MKVRLPVQPLSSKQQKARDKEILIHCDKINEKFLEDVELMLMYVIHKSELNYGPKRLKRIYLGFTKMFNELKEQYVFDDPDDVMWVVEKKLKEIGADVRAWREESKRGDK